MSDESCPNNALTESPVWIPRKNTPSDHNDTSVILIHKDEEEELDTDLETDRLLGQQRLEEQEYPSWTTTTKPQTFSSATIRQGIGTCLTPGSPERCQIIREECSLTSPKQLQYQKSPNGSLKSKKDCSTGSGDNKKRNREGWWFFIYFLLYALFISFFLFHVLFILKYKQKCVQHFQKLCNFKAQKVFCFLRDS